MSAPTFDAIPITRDTHDHRTSDSTFMRSFGDRESADIAYADLLSLGFAATDIRVTTPDAMRRQAVVVPPPTRVDNGLLGALLAALLFGTVGSALMVAFEDFSAVRVPGSHLLIDGLLANALLGGGLGAMAGACFGWYAGSRVKESEVRRPRVATADRIEIQVCSRQAIRLQ